MVWMRIQYSWDHGTIVLKGDGWFSLPSILPSAETPPISILTDLWAFLLEEVHSFWGSEWLNNSVPYKMSLMSLSVVTYTLCPLSGVPAYFHETPSNIWGQLTWIFKVVISSDYEFLFCTPVIFLAWSSDFSPSSLLNLSSPWKMCLAIGSR